MDAFATLGPAEDRPLPPPPVAGGMMMQPPLGTMPDPMAMGGSAAAPAVPDPLSGASLFPPATTMPAPMPDPMAMPAPAMPAAPQSGASLFPAAPPMPTSTPAMPEPPAMPGSMMAPPAPMAKPPVPPIPAAAAGTGGAAPSILSPTGTAIFGSVSEPTAPQSNTPEFNNVQLWKDGFHQGMAADAVPAGAVPMPGMAAMPPATPAANPSPKLMVTPTPLKVANMLAAPLDLAQPPAPAPAPPQAPPDAFSSFAAPAPQIPAPAFAPPPPPPRAPEVAPDAFPPRAPVAAPTGAALFGAASPSDADSDAASAFGTPAKPVVLGGGGSPPPPPTSRSGSFSPRGAGKHFREFTPPPPAPEEAFGAPPPVSVGRAAAAAAFSAPAAPTPDPFGAPAAPADPFSAPPPPVSQAPSDPFGAPAAPADPFSAPPPPVNQAPAWGFEARLREIFDRVDTSGDGEISVVEAVKALRKDDDFAKVLGFDKATRVRQEDGTRDQLILALGALDTDGDKKVSWAEFRRVATTFLPFGAPAAPSDPFSAPAAAADPFSAPPPVNQVPSDPFGAPAAPSNSFSAPAAPTPDPFGAPAATDPFSAPSAPVGQPSDPFGAPQPPPRAPQPPQDAFAAPAPPSADPFHAAPSAPGVFHGGWGGQQPPPSNAFAAANQTFESPAPKAQPRNTASPDLFGGSVAPSTVSSGEKKKAAKNFDFGLHSELISLDLNANGAPPKAKSAIKQKPAVAMNKMATTERRSSMLSTQPLGAPPAMGMPQAPAMGIQAHPAFARYTPEQQQWLLAQTPQVQAQYLQ